MKATRLRNIVVAFCVVACLCFSIGEGLRLTPFPVALASQTEQIKAFDESVDSLRRYGPLDVPARAQSRNKRYVVDYAFSAPARSAALHSTTAFAIVESHKLQTAHPGLTPIGRAPPAC